MKKFLSLLLICFMLLGLLPISAYAAPEYRYIQAYMSTSQSYETLMLVRNSGHVLIDAADMARAAGMDVAVKGGLVTFTRPNSSFTYRTGAQVYDGTHAYIPLKTTADALHVSYSFSEDTQTLYTIHGRGFVEDLLALCKEVLPNSLSDSKYYLGYIYDTPGAELATVYGILTQSGFLPADLLTYLTGQYDRKLYESCLYDLLSHNESSAYQLEQFLNSCNKDLDAIFSALETESNVEKKLSDLLYQGGINLYEEEFWMGYPTEDLIAVYDTVSSMGTLGINGFLTMYHKLNLSSTAASIYLDAFNGSLGPYASQVDDANLRAAAGELYGYTQDASPELATTLYSLGTDLAEEALKGVIKNASKAIRNKYSGLISSIGIKVTDKLMGKNIRAVEYARILAEIQYETYASVPTLNPDNPAFNADQIKNAAIMFLRATQCGYEKFTNDKKVGAACQVAADGAFDMICKIAAINTNELSAPANNRELSSFFSSMTKDKNSLNTLERGVQSHLPHILATAAIRSFMLNQTATTYRYDFTGDGIKDYIISRSREGSANKVWCLIQGGTTTISPIVFGGTTTGRTPEVCRSVSQNIAYISYYDSKDRRYFVPFRGALGLPILRGQGDRWTANNKILTSAEANEYLAEYQLYTFGTDHAEDVTDYLLDASITPDMIENIAQSLSHAQETEMMAAADINGDGIRDAALCIFSPNDIVSYVDGDAENGYYNDIDLWYTSSCAMLLSEGNRVRVKILEYYSAKTEIAKAAQNATAAPKPAATQRPAVTTKPAATPKPTATKKPAATKKVTPRPTATPTKKPMKTSLSDGMHYVVLYKNYIQKQSSGWTANVNILQLDKVLENGVAVYYISGSDVLPVSKNASFAVQQPDGREKNVADIYKLFNSTLDYSGGKTDDSAIRVRVTIKNGQATKMVWEWSPASEEWD